MPQPLYVGVIAASGSNVSSLTVTRSCAAGDTLVVGIALYNASQSVSGITDSQGSSMGVPINRWQRVGAQTFGNVRLEYWACNSNTATGSGIAAITALTIALTGPQYIRAMVGEYSNNGNGCAFGVTRAFQVNAGDNPHTNQNLVLNVTEEAVADQIMVTFFAESFLDPTTLALIPFGGVNAGTQRDLINPSGSIPGLALIEADVADANDLYDTQASVVELATAANLAVCNLQAITLMLSGGLTLTSIPGFADIPDSAFAAGQICRGIQLAKISENAEFGMVRFETFQGTYSDGETVELPVSPVDGYQYSREELIYIWEPLSTVNPSTGWASDEEALWFANWSVDQYLSPLSPGGGVHSEEWYTWIHNSKPNSQSNDGILMVTTIAQRGSGGSYSTSDLVGVTPLPSGVLIETPPTHSDIADSSFAQDDPFTQGIAQQMNENAKAVVVNVEGFYMGEFYPTGPMTVPQPVSPVDGYVYPYANCAFVTSFRWTTLGGQYTQSPCADFLQDFGASVNGSGVVSILIYLWNSYAGIFPPAGGFGRVAVFAICTRPLSGTPWPLGDDFREIDLLSFIPGNPEGLEYTLLQQVNDNSREAISSPEIFGPTNYANGATVPTPVSARDGYAYVRSELTYLWSIHSTAEPGASGVRIVVLVEFVNSTSGLVSIQEYRLPAGGAGTLFNSGSLDVTVIAQRQRVGAGIVGSSSNPPSDLGSPVPGGTYDITVNGI